MNILRSISFALTSVLHQLIPKLYTIFETLASQKFFTEENLVQLSNNIYILVSVIMLFAFGIKLISTIVNPDLVDDKKKGTGKTFINAIIAVVLITLIPFGFNKLYEAQENIINSQLIEKIVFGMDVESDENKKGQVLAGYTFNAFCHPNSEVSSEEIATSGGDAYNKAITEDIKYIDIVGDSINAKTDGEWELDYNILLSPLAGGYVCYELILLCIDTAFRSVKLGLLQLIAPLVLCAFVFAGSDLLTRWLKEVVSTFVIVFVKIAALTFMVYGLSLLPDFWKNIQDTISNNSWFVKGFINIVILIALLQLVKKLPDIINKVFGTDIKPQGGIGNRLADMAGVGNLAKSAWDKLKTKTAGAAAGIAGRTVGAAGAYAKNRGAAIRKNWTDNYKGKGLKEKFKTAGRRFSEGMDETKKRNAERAERFANASIKDKLKMFGSGGKAVASFTGSTLKEALKALGGGFKAGNFAGGFKAGKEMSAVKVSNVMSKDMVDTARTKYARRNAGLDEETGKLSATSKAALSAPDATITQNEFLRNSVRAERASASDTQRTIAEKYGQAKGKETLLKKALSAKDSMAGVLSQMGNSLSMGGNEDDRKLGEKLSELATGISDSNGNVDLASVMSQVSKLSSRHGVDLSTRFEEALKTLQNGQDNYNNAVKSLNNNFGEDAVKSGYINSANKVGSVKDSKSLNSQITTAEIQTKNMESLYNGVTEASTQSEKEAMTRITTSAGTLYGMVPEYEQAKRPQTPIYGTDSDGNPTIVGYDGGAVLHTDSNGNPKWDIGNTVSQYEYDPSLAPQQQAPHQVPQPGDPNFVGPLPASQQTPQPGDPNFVGPLPANQSGQTIINNTTVNNNTTNNTTNNNNNTSEAPTLGDTITTGYTSFDTGSVPWSDSSSGFSGGSTNTPTGDNNEPVREEQQSTPIAGNNGPIQVQVTGGTVDVGNLGGIEENLKDINKTINKGNEKTQEAIRDSAQTTQETINDAAKKEEKAIKKTKEAIDDLQAQQKDINENINNLNNNDDE